MSVVLLAVLLGACASPDPGVRPTGRTSLDGDVRLPSDSDQGEMDFGQDWARVEASIGAPVPTRTSAATPRMADPTGVGIALGTYTGAAHQQQAAIALGATATQAPDLADGLRIHTDERGSMLVYGQYGSFDDPSLRRDLRRLKRYTVDGKRVFGLVLPAQLRAPLNLDDLDPLDLRTVRLRNPDIRVIYTLEVAWWGPAGTAGPPSNGQGSAIALAQALRRAGHEAYFLHESHRNRSSVCVGVFDYLAIDAASGIESTPVVQTRQSFPAVLVNGVEQTRAVDPRRPDGRHKPVPPALIDVPRP